VGLWTGILPVLDVRTLLDDYDVKTWTGATTAIDLEVTAGKRWHVLWFQGYAATTASIYLQVVGTDGTVITVGYLASPGTNPGVYVRVDSVLKAGQKLRVWQAAGVVALTGNVLVREYDE